MARSTESRQPLRRRWSDTGAAKRASGGLAAGALLLSACHASAASQTTASREDCGAPTVGVTGTHGIGHLETDPSWRYEPGATRSARAVHVEWQGRAIVHQDGTYGMPNPPVNYAMAVDTKGGFTVVAHLTDVEKSAALQLYGVAPLILDEFRYDPGSLRLTLQAGRLRSDMWACAMQDPSRLRTDHRIPVKRDYVLRVEDADGKIRVFVDNALVTSMPDEQIFRSGRLWFGLDSGVRGGSYDLTGLRVSAAAPSGAVRVTHPLGKVFAHKAANGLQQLVDRIRPGFRIGAAVSIGPLASDARYRRLALDGNFGQFTTENAGKPQFVEPRPGVFDYGEEDLIARAARRNGIDIHGHTAVFGEADPRWMTELAARHPERMGKVMDSLITHDVRRYRGVMTSYDVLDEPISDDQSHLLRNDIWLRSIGRSYVARAFRDAHKANPQLQLCLNDYGLEADDTRWVDTYRYVKHLVVDRHVPIGCVGFESHVYQHSDEEYSSILKRHIEALAAIGVDSRVSEMDVEGDDGSGFQSEQFSSILGACLSELTCDSFTTWGIGGLYGSTSYVDDSGLHYGNGLLWDRDLRPTPALLSLRAMLRARIRR